MTYNSHKFNKERGILMKISPTHVKEQMSSMESVTQIITQIVGKIPDSEKEIAIIAMNAYTDGFIARSSLESPKQTA